MTMGSPFVCGYEAAMAKPPSMALSWPSMPMRAWPCTMLGVWPLAWKEKKSSGEPTWPVA